MMKKYVINRLNQEDIMVFDSLADAEEMMLSLEEDHDYFYFCRLVEAGTRTMQDIIERVNSYTHYAWDDTICESIYFPA